MVPTRELLRGGDLVRDEAHSFGDLHDARQGGGREFSRIAKGAGNGNRGQAGRMGDGPHIVRRVRGTSAFLLCGHGSRF